MKIKLHFINNKWKMAQSHPSEGVTMGQKLPIWLKHLKIWRYTVIIEIKLCAHHNVDRMYAWGSNEWKKSRLFTQYLSSCYFGVFCNVFFLHLWHLTKQDDSSKTIRQFYLHSSPGIQETCYLSIHVMFWSSYFVFWRYL